MPERNNPFHVASDMEDDVRVIIDYARALTYMGRLDTEATGAVQQLAYSIIKRGEAIEARRC